MSEIKRQAKCDYFGAKTERVRLYANCECMKCREAMGDSDKGKCQCVAESRPELAFFKAKPEAEFDTYYCGCQGWD